MRLRSIAPQFVVPDALRAAEYYRDILGFELLGTFGSPPVFAIVRRDQVEIHFGTSDSGRPAPGSADRDEGLDAYIFVDDIDALHAELVKRGAEMAEGPVERVYGRREIVVRDGNGFRIAFGQ